MLKTQTRRRFLTTLSLAGAAGFVRAQPALDEDGAPEITSVRIQKSPSICTFDAGAVYQALTRGDYDFVTDFAPLCVNAIDQGMAVTVLAGLHAGCFELFANEDVHSIADLRGKAVGVAALGSPSCPVRRWTTAHTG